MNLHKPIGVCPECGQPLSSNGPCGCHIKNNIFSGENSRRMWDEINELRIGFPSVWETLYTMGCKLQELEHKVDESSNRIEIKAPVYYVQDLSVSSPQHLPDICLDEFYTADDLAKIFDGIRKSYYPNKIQFYCDDYSILFKEL